MCIATHPSLNLFPGAVVSDGFTVIMSSAPRHIINFKQVLTTRSVSLKQCFPPPKYTNVTFSLQYGSVGSGICQTQMYSSRHRFSEKVNVWANSGQVKRAIDIDRPTTSNYSSKEAKTSCIELQKLHVPSKACPSTLCLLIRSREQCSCYQWNELRAQFSSVFPNIIFYNFIDSTSILT